MGWISHHILEMMKTEYFSIKFDIIQILYGGICIQ